MRYAALLSAASLLVTGCSIFEDEAQRGFQRTVLGTEPIMVTTADVRLVHQRRHPESGQEVVCAEPTPDVAKAIAAAVQLSAAAASQGSGAFSGATAEAVTELAGRSTALLGLRDGLYRTCEAYANGAIGDDAYALVLSRYGQLMTTLFLGQDVAAAEKGVTTVLGTANAGTVATTFSATGPVAPPTAPAVNSTKGADASDKTNTIHVASLVSLPEELTRPEQAAAEQVAQSKFRNTSLPKLIQLASLNPVEVLLAEAKDDKPGPTPAPAGQPVVVVNQNTPCAPAVSCPPAKSPPAAPKAPTTQKSTPAATDKPPPAPMGAAEALMWMNKDYFDLDRLDQNAVHLLTVACINEFDTTRYLSATYPQHHNAWLQAQCNKFNPAELIQQVANLQAQVALRAKSAQKPTPVKIRARAPRGQVQPKPAGGPAAKPPAAAVPPADGPAPMPGH